MAKTLTQRIADRVTKADRNATKKNRAIFLALRSEVEAAMRDGWPIKTIWETLHEEGKVSFSYQSFRLYVNNIVLSEGPAAAVQRPGHLDAALDVTASTSSAPTQATDVPKSRGAIITPQKGLGGFNFETKLEKDNLV